MMLIIRLRFAAVPTLALIPILAGCASSEPSRFYVLSSLAEAPLDERAASAMNEITLAVAPVELPRYLDRPQIAIRVAPNRLELFEFERWAEPLEYNVTRVIAENLSVFLATDRVAVFPRKLAMSYDYQVAVVVTRLDATPGGETTLDARWTVLEKDGQRPPLMRRSSIAKIAQSQGFASLAEAQSLALAELSEDIAKEIKAIAQAKPKP
jgi:uncharacterized lipoprotein YmbA